MAEKLQQKYGGKMFMVDPPVVDELCDLARITGVKGIYRMSGYSYPEPESHGQAACRCYGEKV